MSNFLHQKKLNKIEILQEIILKFMLQIPPYLDLIIFYQTKISNQSKQLQIFKPLQALYSFTYSVTYQYQPIIRPQCKYFTQMYLRLDYLFQKKEIHMKKAMCYSKYQRELLSKYVYQNILTNSKAIENISLTEYFEFTLNYITLTQNYFDSDLKKKEKVCQFFLQYFKYSAQEPYFQDKCIQTLAVTFFCLLKIGTKHVNKQKKLQFYLKVIENLFILGVKLAVIQKSFNEQDFLKQFSFYNQHLQYWKYLTFIQSYQFNILSKNSSQIQIFYEQKSMEAFFKRRSKIRLFNNQNNQANFYRNFLIWGNQLKNGDILLNFQLLWNHLRKRQYFPQLQHQQYLQFCFSILSYAKFYLSQISLKKVCEINLKILQIFNLYQISTHKHRSIPIYLSAMIMTYSQLKNYNKVQKILQFFDNIVNIQNVSFLYYIDERLSIAYYMYDNALVTKVSSMVFSLKADNFFNYFRVFNRLSVQNYSNIFTSLNSLQSIKINIQSMFQSFYQKIKPVVCLIEEKMIQIYHQILNITSENDNEYRLKEKLKYLLEIQMNFCLIEKTHKLTKNAFKDQFWKKRITFLYQFSKKVLLFPDKFSFYTQIYKYFLKEVYCKNKDDLMKQINELILSWPEMKNNRIIQRFKREKLILTFQADLFIDVFFQNCRHQLLDQRQNYQQLLDFYKELYSQNKLDILYSYYNVIIHVWNGYILCKTSYEQKLKFIEINVTYLAYKYRTAFHTFNYNISEIFSFQSVEGYSSQKLIQNYLLPLLKDFFEQNEKKDQNHLFEQRVQNNPYWTMIFYYILKSNKIHRINRKQISKIIKFICFNIERLFIDARQCILTDFYQIIDRIKWMENQKHQLKKRIFRKCCIKQKNSRVSKILRKNIAVHQSISLKLWRIKQISDDL